MSKSLKKNEDWMPSLKEIQKVLNEAKFNPKTPGPLNIVAHSTGPKYLESRSMEFIMEAQINRGDLASLSGFIQANNLDEDKERFKKAKERYRHKIIRAIQCLALAVIKTESGDYD